MVGIAINLFIIVSMLLCAFVQVDRAKNVSGSAHKPGLSAIISDNLAVAVNSASDMDVSCIFGQQQGLKLEYLCIEGHAICQPGSDSLSVR